MADDDTHELASEFDVEFEEGLPPSVDRAAIRRMRAVAYLLDESVRVPGTSFRIGIDPVIGVLPVAGDLVSAALSLYIVAESARLGVSSRTIVMMLANISLDVAGGSVPYVGGLFDAAWKANRRNVALVLEDLAAGAGPEDRDEGGRRIDID